MLALCLMLLATYYAQNYAGIIGWSLITIHKDYKLLVHPSKIINSSGKMGVPRGISFGTMEYGLYSSSRS